MKCALMSVLLLGVWNTLPAFAIVGKATDESSIIRTSENTGILPTPNLSPEQVIESTLRLLQNNTVGNNEGVLNAFRFISPNATSSIATIGPYIAMLASSFREILANRSHSLRRITTVSEDAAESSDVELEDNSSLCFEMMMTSSAHENDADDHAEDVASVIWCLSKQPQSNGQCPNCWLIHSIKPSQGMPGVPIMTIEKDGVFVEYPNATKRSSFVERCKDEFKWAALAGCMFFASMVVAFFVVRTHLNKAKINVETLTEKIRLEHSTILYSPSKFTGLNWKLPKTPLENPLTPSPLKMGSSTQSLFGNYDGHHTPNSVNATPKNRGGSFNTTVRALHRGPSPLSMDTLATTCSTPHTPSSSPTPRNNNYNNNDQQKKEEKTTLTSYSFLILTCKVHIPLNLSRYWLGETKPPPEHSSGRGFGECFANGISSWYFFLFKCFFFPWPTQQ
eukprot:m.211791 g.211791  ORF g.211791 m.211791 type:complete len:450 (-) comp33110_c2_seq2:156-1505(-)